jgi:hypothetical protein
MKIYQTEYITKSNLSRIQHSHAPHQPDKLIGDFIQVTIFEGSRCPNSDECDCGKEHMDYATIESEIVEIRQTFKWMTYNMAKLLGVDFSETSV